MGVKGFAEVGVGFASASTRNQGLMVQGVLKSRGWLWGGDCKAASLQGVAENRGSRLPVS